MPAWIAMMVYHFVLGTPWYVTVTVTLVVLGASHLLFERLDWLAAAEKAAAQAEYDDYFADLHTRFGIKEN